VPLVRVDKPDVDIHVAVPATSFLERAAG